MTDLTPLTDMSTYHVRHAGTADRAATDIAGLLDLGVRLIDVSVHDRHATTITLLAAGGKKGPNDDR